MFDLRVFVASGRQKSKQYGFDRPPPSQHPSGSVRSIAGKMCMKTAIQIKYPSVTLRGAAHLHERMFENGFRL